MGGEIHKILNVNIGQFLESIFSHRIIIIHPSIFLSFFTYYIYLVWMDDRLYSVNKKDGFLIH